MKNTTTSIMQMKNSGHKISMLTAYDYTTARLLDEAGVNTILVGDSLGNVILGYEDTISVTVEDMIHHSAAVARGAKNALVVTDLPIMSYQTSVYDAVVNAGRLMKEGRAGAVKVEGGKEVCPQINAIVSAGIPVVAHLGLTPQSINTFGGFKVQGKTEAAAKKLIEDAKAVEEAGGLTANAQAEAVNLARILADSEQIYIPNISESIDQIENETQNVISSAAVVPSASSDGLLNINQASESELMQLPGIGQVKAAAIVTYRNSNGPFSSIEEIKNVPGILEAAFEKIKGMITVF